MGRIYSVLLSEEEVDNVVHIYTLDIDELQALAQSRVTCSLTTEACPDRP